MRVFPRSISTSATVASLATAALFALVPLAAHAQRAARPRTAQPRQAEDPRNSQTEKPPLHATHWLAITGKPLSATAGALIFAQGGNAVDAAAAMLAAGCTMIVKPASQTPMTALALGELALRAGVPAGALSVVTGNDTRVIGNVLTSHELVRKITFTGSTEVGRVLLQQSAATVKTSLRTPDAQYRKELFESS